MKYWSQYFWEQSGRGDTAVLLQQLEGKRGGEPVLLLAVCQAKGEPGLVEYLTTGLLDWFRHDGLRESGRIRRDMGAGLEEALQKYLERLADTALRTEGHNRLNLSGALCVGEGIWCFGMGSHQCFWIQSGFQRTRLRQLCPGKRLWLQGWELQEGVCLLVTTTDFRQALGEEELRECLSVAELDAEWRMGKRLQELGRLAQERRGEGAAAVLMKYAQGQPG